MSGFVNFDSVRVEAGRPGHVLLITERRARWWWLFRGPDVVTTEFPLWLALLVGGDLQRLAYLGYASGGGRA